MDEFVAHRKKPFEKSAPYIFPVEKKSFGALPTVLTTGRKTANSNTGRENILYHNTTNTNETTQSEQPIAGVEAQESVHEKLSTEDAKLKIKYDKLSCTRCFAHIALRTLLRNLRSKVLSIIHEKGTNLVGHVVLIVLLL